MTTKRKNQLELYSSVDQFFNDANYSRKAVVKTKLKGMSEDHFMEWRFYLAYRHFNGGSNGFQFTPETIVKMWEHYNDK